MTPLLIMAGLVALWVMQRPRRTRRGDPAMLPEEARALLELTPGADLDSVRAAHRRLIRRVHPDNGGSAELARRVNLARDVLVGELRRSA